MKITGNTDSHFVIGKKHITQNAPCQDHALSGQLGEYLFAVVSDGCSSGRHTDIGARIITCATISAIKACLEQTTDLALLPGLIHQTLIEHAQQTVVQMGLDNQDLLATCVYALVTPTGGFVHILGDGHVAINYCNGDLQVINTEWQNNTPYYPADNRKQLFIADHSRTEQGAKSLELERVSIIQGEVTTEKSFIDINQAVAGYVLPITEQQLETIEVISLASDGMGRFKKEGAFLPPLETIQTFTRFKNWVGEFVKRRLSRGLLDYGRNAIVPDDDVAIAAIHLEHKTV